MEKLFTFFVYRENNRVGGTLAASFKEAEKTFGKAGLEGVLVCKGTANTNPETKAKEEFRFSASQNGRNVSVWFEQAAGGFIYGGERREMSEPEFTKWANPIGRPTSFVRKHVN